MKKLLALLLALSICMLCGCGSAEEAPTTEATTPTTTAAPTETVAETTVPETTEATEATEAAPVYRNPLTGETLEAPLESRIFGVSIDNVPGALPHVNVSKADMVFEMFINDHATRCLALYTDVASVDRIGAVRSMRVNFTDIAQGYDAVIAHAGGSSYVLRDVKASGIDHFNVDVSGESYYALRDQNRMAQGIARVHSLVAKGPGLVEMALKNSMRITQDPDKVYGLNFTETPCPVDGTDANRIVIDFVHDGVSKITTMTYDASLGEYIYTQYKKQADSVTQENMETFKNVFVVMTTVTNVDVYHIADILGSGDGYFACEGKMIPIKWIRENETDPFTFTLTDGTPLEQGIGSSYVGITPLTSSVTAE